MNCGSSSACIAITASVASQCEYNVPYILAAVFGNYVYADVSYVLCGSF